MPNGGEKEKECVRWRETEEKEKKNYGEENKTATIELIVDGLKRQAVDVHIYFGK